MKYLFSAQKKHSTWRKLWVILAESEMELGLNITSAQIEELRAETDNINFGRAEDLERQLRHDVMAHVHAYGEQCPGAAGIIHLGATSCYVTDNADILIYKEALELAAKKLTVVIRNLKGFALEWRGFPTLGFTHFQPAQLTTVGKRAALWLQDFVSDLTELEYRVEKLRPRGAKGTTGTQASFMSLFDGDAAKVKALDKRVADKMGFETSIPVTGQTYSRKIDFEIVSALAGLAQSASKFATDMRLLSHLKEIEEPFESAQIGSSAMPYKRNPMRCERICALARYLINDLLNPAFTAATQWLERTLDDSANRRIAVSEAFLSADAILNVLAGVTNGLQVYPKVIEKHVTEELPFMATENILMSAVKRGGNRQDMHERIRVLSIAAGNSVKRDGLPNDLIDRIADDPAFGLTRDEILNQMRPELYTGRAAEQVTEFIADIVDPILEKYSAAEMPPLTELIV
jgi:adenylosuccinate lyase